MLKIIDNTVNGKAIGEFCVNSKIFGDFDYKQKDLTIGDFVKRGFVKEPKVRVKGFWEEIVPLDTKIEISSEYSSSSTDSECEKFVIFQVEVENERVLAWKNKEYTNDWIGRCFKTRYSANSYFKVVALNTSYELNYPHYSFVAILVNEEYKIVKKKIETVSMFDLQQINSYFEEISVEEFKKKFDEVINELKSKI